MASQRVAFSMKPSPQCMYESALLAQSAPPSAKFRNVDWTAATSTSESNTMVAIIASPRASPRSNR